MFAVAVLTAAFAARRASGEALLAASVASTFPAQSRTDSPAALAVFSFTTAQADFFERHPVELRAVFLPSPALGGHVAALRNAPVTGCHDLLAEVGEFFPSPLSCYSGSFEGADLEERFFGVRFGTGRSLKSGSSYSFVVVGLELLRVGVRSNFAWRLELRDAGSGEIRGAPTIATLTTDVLPEANCAASLSEFRVRGGQDMLRGTLRKLWISLRLANQQLLRGAYRADVVVTFLPLLIWDQVLPACEPDTGSFGVAACEFRRAAPDLGYNQLLIRPKPEGWPAEGLLLAVALRTPMDPHALLPVELMASMETNTSLCGPLFEGMQGDQTESTALELYTRVAPQVTITSVGDRMQGRRDNPVTFAIRLGATLRGYSLRGESRRLTLSITASSFFVITGAAGVDGAAMLGTDRTPDMVISEDGQKVTFTFGGLRCIAFGNVEYSFRLFVTNPPRYFWAILEAPWSVVVEQGPRLDCVGCPDVRYETPFQGPLVDFAILRFQVLPGSLLLGSHGDFVFSFQLIGHAQQFELLLPDGYEARSCALCSSADLDPYVRRFVVCAPEAGVLRVIRQPPGRPAMALPKGFLLSFRSVMHAPTVVSFGADAVWSARALDNMGEMVARTRDDDNVRSQLYAQELPSFGVYANDRHPSVITVVMINFVVGHDLRPGDRLRVSAPADFRWSFTASEFEASAAGVEQLLPTEVPMADGSSHVLELSVTGVMEAGISYGFSAMVVHPLEKPLDYHWHLETFGPGATEGIGELYEAASKEAYELSMLLDAEIVPWTRVRAGTGPATFSFKTTQAVEVGGGLVLRSPSEFAFTSTCAVSMLQLGLQDESAPVAIPAAAMACSVLTPNEVHLRLTTSDPNGFRGLSGGQGYTVTVHSLTNAGKSGSAAASLHRWRLETRDAGQLSLDLTTSVQGFFVGEELPYAALLQGGPASGADLRAGELSWVTVALRLAAATRPGQSLGVRAARGFVFETFCSVRDPPLHAAPDCEFVGHQLSDCMGFGDSAELVIQTVWRLRNTYAFQIQVRNALPLAEEEASRLEIPFLNTWRLCVDSCHQMRTGLVSPPVRGFSDVGILTTSSIIGDHASLVVSFVLSTSIPPEGQLRVRAPSGYTIDEFCEGFTPAPGGASTAIGDHYAVPEGTRCEAGALPGSTLQPSELLLSVGSRETGRLQAHRPYALTIGIRNPSSSARPVGVAWEFRTYTPAGLLIDATRTSMVRPAAGELLLPLLPLALGPASRFAGVDHSVILAFRALRSDEGSDEELVPFAARIEVRAPVDRDRKLRDDNDAESGDNEWDLTVPPACSAPFVSRLGDVSIGLRHGNVTTPGGVVACLAEGRRALSLTFRPSAVSTERVVTLEFAVRNPASGPRSLWNSWRVRVAILRATVAQEASIREVAFVAAQRELFVDVCEANFAGFSVVRMFAHIGIQSSSYAVNETSIVDFQIRTHVDAPRGTVLAITAPAGFILQTLRSSGAGGVADSGIAMAAGSLELLPPSGGASPNRALLLFGSLYAVAGPMLAFAFTVVNPALPTNAERPPLWEFELRSSGGDSREEAAVLERTSNFVGYDVHLLVEVAGLFGSIREIGSKYNFVRITFRLPVALPREGILHVVAPPGYILLIEGFSRENLPPFSELVVPVAGVAIDPWSLKVSVLYGLHAFTYYAIRFGVENPPSQPVGSASNPWEFRCLSPDGTVIAANRQVPAFELEARFRSVDVLPSSVVPLKSPNVLEVQMELDSSPLSVVRSPMQHDTARLIIQLPQGFRLAGLDNQAVAASAAPAMCYLGLATMGAAIKAAELLPLPSGSRCTADSDDRVVIELENSLLLGTMYYFALELANPLQTPASNTWRVSTERNSALLHLAMEVQNFAVASVSSFSVAATDLRRDERHLLRVTIRPPRHIRGLSAVEVRAPKGFELGCQYRGKAPPAGVMPVDAECLLLGDMLQVTLPRPAPYAPYVPALLVDEEYYFGIYCLNPSIPADSGGVEYFDVRLVEEWPKPRILGLRADVPSPELAASLDFFEVSPREVMPAGELTDIIVRFRAPAVDNYGSNVRAVFLEGPTGMPFTDGISSPCIGFKSIAEGEDDTVVPQAVCSGVSLSAVVIQLSEPLPLNAVNSVPTFIFQLSVRSPGVEAMVDNFLLALQPGPGAAPLFAASAPGFQSQVVGLQAAQLPPLPLELNVPVPQDSELPPLSTVNTEASSMSPRAMTSGLRSVALAIVVSLLALVPVPRALSGAVRRQ